MRDLQVNMDVLGMSGGQGIVAEELIKRGKLDAGAMRPFIGEDGRVYVTVCEGNPKLKSSYKTYPIQANTTSTLRRDEWKQLDDVIMDVSRQRLGGVQYLIGKGLTYNLGNAMGTTVLEWHDVSDALEAEMTMDAVTRARNDRPVYQFNYLPIPIIHVDFEINARELAASRNLGNPLDTTLLERATRKVLEKREQLLYTDTSYSYGEKDSRNRNTIYSFLNHPDRNAVNLSVAWDGSAITGALVLQDVMEMKKTSIAAYHYGPWVLFVPTAYESILDEDYSVSGQNLLTIRERLMKLDGIKDIITTDYLTASNVVLVQLTSDVVRIVNGMGIQVVQWGVEGNFITKFKVLTIQVPQIRSDQNGKSGIVHLA